MLKNWRAFGPWFQRRLRVLWTRYWVQFMLWAWRVWGRAFESVLRMRLVMVMSCGGGDVVERWWDGGAWGESGKKWGLRSFGCLRNLLCWSNMLMLSWTWNYGGSVWRLKIVCAMCLTVWVFEFWSLLVTLDQNRLNYEFKWIINFNYIPNYHILWVFTTIPTYLI